MAAASFAKLHLDLANALTAAKSTAEAVTRHPATGSSERVQLRAACHAIDLAWLAARELFSIADVP